MFNIKSKITIKVLNYYFLNPKAKKYINELAGILEIDLGNLDKKLKELKMEGILCSESAGKERYYFLNNKYPLLKEVKKIFKVKYGLEVSLFEKLKNIKGLKEAYIFGSYARGNFGLESDIDLLLIGSHSSIEAKRSIIELQNQSQREFNVIDLMEKEYKEKIKNKDELLDNIFKNKKIKII